MQCKFNANLSNCCLVVFNCPFAIKSNTRVARECHRLDEADTCMQVFFSYASRRRWKGQFVLAGIYFREKLHVNHFWTLKG